MTTDTTSLKPPDPVASDICGQWALDQSITFLNHGTFGARLKSVLAAQQAWRDAFEAKPIETLDRRRDEIIDRAKGVVGRFLGMKRQDFGFVTNATNGINAVLRSLPFAPGDELLTTNHVYHAVRLTMRHLADHARAAYIEVDVPFPVASPDEITHAIESRLSSRTRLVLIDHVTSPTALVFPVERIVRLCAERGVDVLIDGAHAPGMLELDVESVGAAYYAGNLHKWVCAPPGAAFIHVRADRQQGIHPTTISHFYDEGLAAEFAWQGTRDISPWVGAATSIEAMSRWDWDCIRRHNHELIVWVQQYLAEQWHDLGIRATTPADGSMLGSMVSFVLPERAKQRFESAQSLQALLYNEERIEAPVMEWNGHWLIRASAQVYNTPDQYERFAAAVRGIFGG